jgi:hypothetical protein
MYRNSLTHSWNLFEAALCPGNECIVSQGGVVSFGLLNFYQALRHGIEDFLDKLNAGTALQRNTIARYESLRRTARAWPDTGRETLTVILDGRPVTGVTSGAVERSRQS